MHGNVRLLCRLYQLLFGAGQADFQQQMQSGSFAADTDVLAYGMGAQRRDQEVLPLMIGLFHAVEVAFKVPFL